MRVVAKVGTSSLTDDGGRIAAGAIAKVAGEVAGSGRPATRWWS